MEAEKLADDDARDLPELFDGMLKKELDLRFFAKFCLVNEASTLDTEGMIPCGVMPSPPEDPLTLALADVSTKLQILWGVREIVLTCGWAVCSFIIINVNHNYVHALIILLNFDMRDERYDNFMFAA